MCKKPKILLSVSDNHNKRYYIDAVNLCGGIAHAQYCPDISEYYDGLILCGGSDIHPKYYSEDIDGSVNIDTKRDNVEFELFKTFSDLKKPIMGICRGFQLINVVLGGSLFQDIKESDKHTNRSDYYITHDVEAMKNSIYENFYGEKFSVNSSHHQAVKKLGDGLNATLRHKNIIEGYEHKTLPIFGAQFHPERMCFSQKRTDTVDGAKLFEYFIKLCIDIK